MDYGSRRQLVLKSKSKSSIKYCIEEYLAQRSADYFSDDLFKYYCANSVLTGSKINLICHGGGGKFKYSDWQDIDFNICDNYFTWGWSESSSKCVQGFFIKDFGYKVFFLD